MPRKALDLSRKGKIPEAASSSQAEPPFSFELRLVREEDIPAMHKIERQNFIGKESFWEIDSFKESAKSMYTCVALRHMPEIDISGSTHTDIYNAMKKNRGFDSTINSKIKRDKNGNIHIFQNNQKITLTQNTQLKAKCANVLKEIIGYGFLEKNSSGSISNLKGGDPVFDIAKISVDPSAQRKKIGDTIISHLVDKSLEEGANFIILQVDNNNPGIALYQKHGFQFTESAVQEKQGRVKGSSCMMSSREKLLQPEYLDLRNNAKKLDQSTQLAQGQSKGR